MEELSGGDRPEMALAAALVSRDTGRGHVCLDLSGTAGTDLVPGGDQDSSVACPLIGDWIEALSQVATIGKPGDATPLILDSQRRLYLSRYFHYEQRLAEFLRSAASEALSPTDPERMKETLERLFPPSAPGTVDWQKVAALTAAVRRFTVITGGPGTGKTTTVAKILALLLELSSGKPLRIALAAPTGKAATRLEEAIGRAVGELQVSDAVRDALPRDASTVHRLLGSLPNSPYFAHDAANPLGLDVLVVDEASMVDLALMAKLVDALPEGARLILLGDKDQLASVEAGAVLGDICNAGEERCFSEPFGHFVEPVLGLIPRSTRSDSPRLSDCIAELYTSYRFGECKTIDSLSRAIRNGSVQEAMDMLSVEGSADFQWRELPSPQALRGSMQDVIWEGLKPYFESESIEEIFDRLASFRLICALRKGPYGVEGLNAMVERILEQQGIVRPRETYAGRPIMITANDYNLRLFNGDLGICLPTEWPEHGTLMTSDHESRATFHDTGKTVRRFPVNRLPSHETAYAITVHKSQGSEFDTVHLILPNHDSPVLTRELLYTGITRAKKKVVLWTPREVFLLALSRRIQRSSGLRDGLWGP
jgi:exodeoxyribonuclease V alpha subunit